MKIHNLIIMSILGVLAMLILIQFQNEKQHTSLDKATPPVQVAVQLWSVKEALNKDFDGTITALAKMGFEGVELANYLGPYADNPQGLLTLLDKVGMTISSAHVGIELLSPQVIDETVKKYQALGVKSLILPWDERAFQPNQFEEFLSDMLRIHKRLAAAEFHFGFHNHQQEFATYKDSTFWDHLAKRTPTDFILQLDIGWVHFAGKDPNVYLERYPKRTPLAHFKAKIPLGVQGKYPVIGLDDQDWGSILHTAIEHGGLKWVVVEQEEYPLDLTPLQALSRSKQALDLLLQQH